MDCCGMPMAVRDGGGLMCRRCGETVGVPVVLPRNPFDVAVTEAPVEVPAPVVIPGVIPEATKPLTKSDLDAVAVAIGLEAAPELAPEAVDVPRGRMKKAR